MNQFFKKFYRDFYNRTNGFIPSMPLTQNMYPGDFFQIKNGEMIVLGNIYKNKIITKEVTELEYGIRLSSANWNFNDGVSKLYSSVNDEQNGTKDLELNRQLLSFNSLGSFIFRSKNMESVKIVNWSNIKNELIIKLTQVMYSFREVYVVTESAVASNWSLAISGSDKGELELTSKNEGSDFTDVFGEEESKTIQTRDIEFYHREIKKKPTFFKAKKLAVHEEKIESFISELLYDQSNKDQWSKNFYNYDYHVDEKSNGSLPTNSRTSLLDMLQANELNPNTALLYFKWTDANSDDIEKLFQFYP